MKTFIEWTADKHDECPPPVLTANSKYHEIVSEIERCISYLESHLDDDRVEFVAYNIKVRIWRVKNEIHLGWKSGCTNDRMVLTGFNEISVDKLADFLYNRRGA